LQNLIFRFIIYFCYKEEMSNPPIYNSKFSPGQSFSPTRASFLPSQISPSYNPTIRSSSPFNPKMQATSVIENDLQDIQKSFEDETQEVQKRYNFIYERYLRLAKTVQELENALDEEKRKNSSLQDSMNAMARDFDNERKVRANLERELAPLRDELKRKDLTIAELEKQLGKFQQNNALLATENNALRAELAKVGQFYQGKLKELEDNYLG
jgi:chromosome segregation ATPase